MKKLLLSLLAVVGISMCATAQKMDVTLGYGGYTLMDMADYHDGWPGVNNGWGTFNVGLNVKVWKFTVGPSYTFGTATTQGRHGGGVQYHAVMLNGKYDYFSAGIFRAYAHMGVGAEITRLRPYKQEAYNKTYFAMQLSPVGVDVSITPNFSLFGEVGVGVQGLLQVGGRIIL